MANKRRNYSSKFKMQVALEAVQERKTITELASEYGVHPNQISMWKKHLKESEKEVFENKRGPGKNKKEKDESVLYEEIGRLKIELDWLKKKLGRE